MKLPIAKIVFGIAGVLIGFFAIVFICDRQNTKTNAAPIAEATSTIETVPASNTGVIGSLYPLFSTGITWTSQVSVSLPPLSNYNPTTQTIVGEQVTSLPTASTADIGAIVGPMRDYYDRVLLEKGWVIDIKFEADGAGGSLWGFTKGNDVLILSYTSTALYQDPNAPKQCPCTLVFTIIGGTLD